MPTQSNFFIQPTDSLGCKPITMLTFLPSFFQHFQFLLFGFPLSPPVLCIVIRAGYNSNMQTAQVIHTKGSDSIQQLSLSDNHRERRWNEVGGDRSFQCKSFTSLRRASSPIPALQHGWNLAHVSTRYSGLLQGRTFATNRGTTRASGRNIGKVPTLL